MRSVANGVFYAMIPVNVLMIAWVWIGRMLFGSGGWFLLILLVSVVPILAAVLAATTVLAFTQRRDAVVGRITGQQTLAQLLTWVGLLGFGFFLVDFGDTTDSESSAFTQLVGRQFIDLSWTLTIVTGALAAAAWIWLLIVLILGNVTAAGERRAAAATAYGAASWPGHGATAPGYGGATAPGYGGPATSGYGVPPVGADAGPPVSGYGLPQAPPPPSARPDAPSAPPGSPPQR